MSLIACTFANDAPFIIGDILFSSQAGNKNFIAPTHTSPGNNDDETSMKPDELFQKIYIIRDNVCIALAGKEIEMTPLLREIRIQMSYHEAVSIEHLQNFLERYDLEINYKMSSFLILVAEKNADGSINFGRFTRGAWLDKVHPVFNEVLACGSGAQSFMDKLDEPFSFTTSFEEGVFRNALTANLILLSQWLATEKITGSTLTDNWGCGFEMIYFDGTAFKKLDQIAFVVLESVMEQSGEMHPVCPTLVNYYTYKEDILLLYSFPIYGGTVREEGDRWFYRIELGNFEQHLFFVPPLDLLPGTVLREEDHSFETRHIAAGVSIWYRNSETFRPGLYLEGYEVALKFKENEFIETSILASLNTEIHTNAVKYIPA